jgi:hypothetical protein
MSMRTMSRYIRVQRSWNTGYTSDQAVHQYLIYHGNLNIKNGFITIVLKTCTITQNTVMLSLCLFLLPLCLCFVIILFSITMFSLFLLAHLAIGHVSFCPSVTFSHLNLLLWNRWTDFNQTCQKYSLDGHIQDLCFWCWQEDF